MQVTSLDNEETISADNAIYRVIKNLGIENTGKGGESIRHVINSLDNENKGKAGATPSKTTFP